ncbi:2OG-Fe(II) oxygenase family protein [Trinickia fusca]|uniref:Fe2OG dioxygenase domain-containing protein n=1 Tax=Trinickia fusca TaxID=2419777 RepID=A0A494XPI5_9BURK|nr:2OG-Fe(II) oxygenase family protein [Trinickia fusca]RKP52538.1 hypothetical protein D7S89_03255 [Trinickia fusca]
MDSPSAEILRLFPTFLWRKCFDPTQEAPFDRDLLAYVEVLRREGHGTQTGAAWQSGHQLQREPELEAFVARIDGAVHDVLAFLKIADVPFRVTGCWANVLGQGGVHAMHSHPNNFLSGVYYLQTQAGADTINFHDPRPQTAVIRPPVSELTAYNTDQVVVAVSDGTLLVFPAWLTHSVSPNASERERISLSFNVMFTEYEATMSSPLWGND